MACRLFVPMGWIEQIQVTINGELRITILNFIDYHLNFITDIEMSKKKYIIS